MNIGKACGIFKQIESDKYSTTEKQIAIGTVLNMETHNGVTKNETLRAFKYFFDSAVPEKQNNWIPVEERLPEDGDCRFYMCLTENHVEDVPMMCQFDVENGFGFYKDIYDPISLGFVDTEFDTMEELGYEKVLYWMQVPDAPIEEENR